MTYIISDIHGCYDEFMNLLKKVNFSDDDELYILGDVAFSAVNLLYIALKPTESLIQIDVRE